MQKLQLFSHMLYIFSCIHVDDGNADYQLHNDSNYSVDAGVVSNISHCQIALICAIARARSRKVSCTAVYLIFISLVTLRLGS